MFLPLSEVPANPAERLAWHVNLPEYVNSAQIGVNTARLNFLARLGCFSELDFATYDGETTTTVPQIEGMQKDGSATAAAATIVRKAHTAESVIEEPSSIVRGSSIATEYIWTKGSVRVNTSEVQQRMSENGMRLRSSEAWAKQLDAALKGGLAEAINHNIVQRSMVDKLIKAGMVAGVTGEYALLDVFGSSSLVLAYPFVQLVLDPLATKIALGRNELRPFKDRHWSLVPGFHLDRLALAHATLHAGRLIKPLKDT